MKNISDKSCREKAKYKFYVKWNFSEKRTVDEIMWKNVEPERLRIAA
jgi:hypothetical protein